MRNHLLVILIALTAGPLPGQQASDMSGTWVATKDAPSGLASAPVAPLGERFAIQQRGDSVTLTRAIRDTTFATRYVLDGGETRVRIPGPLCQADVETIETAALAADGLVITMIGHVPPGGGAVVKRQSTRTIRRAGPDTLVVESRMMVQGQLRPVGTVYRKSAEPLPDAPATTATVSATIAQVGWIAGTWSGTVKDTTVDERWTPPSGGSMLAMGRTLRGGVMGSFEFVCIAERGGGLVYSAMPNGRFPATHFMLTAIDEHSATFENAAHDFPKVIRYARRADGQLETTVSGEGGQRAQSVVLKRQE